MIGAFVTVIVASRLSDAYVFWVGLVLALAVVGAVGALIEVTVLRRDYREEHLVQLLGTYALSLIIAGLVRIVFGANYRTTKAPPLFSGSVPVGGVASPRFSVFIV